jgi:hypothetical protein
MSESLVFRDRIPGKKISLGALSRLSFMEVIIDELGDCF